MAYQAVGLRTSAFQAVGLGTSAFHAVGLTTTAFHAVGLRTPTSSVIFLFRYYVSTELRSPGLRTKSW
jgi:hypothetical protein